MTLLQIEVDNNLISFLNKKGFEIVGFFPPKHGDFWLRTNSLNVGRWNDALGKSELPKLILRCCHCGGSGEIETV